MADVCFVPSFLTPVEAADPSSAPLGVLTLASVVARGGVESAVVEGNRCFETGDPAEAARRLDDVADEIVATGARVVGFSAMCSSLPVSVAVARRVRERRPDACILFGGPQPSVVANDLLAAFSWIDAVFVGEADEQIATVVERASTGRMLSGIPGIVAREAWIGRAAPQADLLGDLDTLAIPDLDRLGRRWGREVAIEAGRGCPYPCTFCSTSHFWKRRFRLKSDQRILDEIEHFHTQYGIERFHLMHDLFTVNAAKVRQFCERLLASPRRFRWTCSSRIDTIDPELVKLMAAAGCDQIYFGLETGSQPLQKRIRKNVDLSKLIPIARAVVESGIHGVYSFVAGFVEEEPADLEATLATAMTLARLRNVDLQCHLLVPLPGTPIFPPRGEGLIFDPTWSDATLPLLPGEMTELVTAHPGLFSSYYRFPEAAVPAEVLRRIPALVRAIKGLPATLDEVRAALGVTKFYELARDWADAEPETTTPEDLILHLIDRLIERHALDLAVKLASVYLRSPGRHVGGELQRARATVWSDAIALHGEAPFLVIRDAAGKVHRVSPGATA